MEKFFIGIMLVFCAAPVLVKTQDCRCYCNREKSYPCSYTDHRRAEPGYYSVHNTKIVNYWNNTIQCLVKRGRKQVRRQLLPILQMGNNGMWVLQSPDFESPYEANLRAEYKVQCGPDELIYYKITHLNTRGKECPVEGKMSCWDYVEVIRAGGSIEECGNTPSRFSVGDIENRQLTVVFRTNRNENTEKDGFEMYVQCYKQAETNQEGCVNCAPGASTTTGKRCACHHHPIGKLYTDFFPNSGFPPNLRMASDLVQFHHKWSRFRGRPGYEILEVDVFYNQTVDYNQSTLTVMDLYGTVIARYHNIHTLETFNSDGEIEKHVAGVDTQRNPHFYGGSLLRIVKMKAYFQLFRIDPRGVIPNENEQIELTRMIKPLLDYAVLNNTNEIILANITDRFQRTVTTPLDFSMFDDEDRDAVVAAVRSENSCNPILRAQSRATRLSYPGSYESHIRVTSEISCPVEFQEY